MQRRWFILAVWLVVSLLAGCGGSGPAGWDIQFTPTAPGVSVNSSVQITIQTSPPIDYTSSTLVWQVGGYPGQCTEGSIDPANAPPLPGCNNGWIAYYTGTGPGNAPTLIYYFAPSTTGTYQISVSGRMYNSSGKLLNQGSATVNVTVTAQ
jgi:hypothetical protein